MIHNAFRHEFINEDTIRVVLDQAQSLSALLCSDTSEKKGKTLQLSFLHLQFLFS